MPITRQLAWLRRDLSARVGGTSFAARASSDQDLTGPWRALDLGSVSAGFVQCRYLISQPRLKQAEISICRPGKRGLTTLDLTNNENTEIL